MTPQCTHSRTPHTMAADATALPLIVPGEGGRLEVGEEAAALLSGVPGPLVVVAVAGACWRGGRRGDGRSARRGRPAAGKYRTGKSYLLNKLAGAGHAFAVSSETQACTKVRGRGAA